MVRQRSFGCGLTETEEGSGDSSADTPKQINAPISSNNETLPCL
jgi:hypothetical protein